ERGAVRLLEQVVPLRQRLQRRRRVPRERRQHARLRGREASAMEPARVAEDDGALRRGEADGAPVDPLRELVLRRIVLPERTPRPQAVALAARCAARDGLAPPALLLEAALGLGDEARAVGLHLLPLLGRDQLRQRQRRVALLPEPVDDPLLRLV